MFWRQIKAGSNIVIKLYLQAKNKVSYTVEIGDISIEGKQTVSEKLALRNAIQDIEFEYGEYDMPSEIEAVLEQLEDKLSELE